VQKTNRTGQSQLEIGIFGPKSRPSALQIRAFQALISKFRAPKGPLSRPSASKQIQS